MGKTTKSTMLDEAGARELLARHGQEQVLRFFGELSEPERRGLLEQLSTVDFGLVDRLVETWVRQQPPPEHFDRIEPVNAIPPATMDRPDACEAWEAGEEALRAGRVGLVLVAGGQGTRLGFDGPKGAYPIAPLTGRTLFQYHADKIHNLQRRYGCRLPWYIMVSDANDEQTRAYFREHDYFGLKQEDIWFFRQAMMPCVDEAGKLMLEEKGRLAMNPNGHGGSIPALVENGIIEDAKRRGVDTLSYFQVDNWAVKVADPFFIGYHVLRGGEMSSKVHRKTVPREAVGVHCLCDGEYRVIEYTELDIYPQLLEADDHGRLRHYAGNPAIHILATGFVERVHGHFNEFPWHCSHKKVPYIDDQGQKINPAKPNAYKFETFVFDALRYTRHEPIALEIERVGEYTPTKQFEGDNSVVAARESMTELWARWLEAAGTHVPRDSSGRPTVILEISPRFALTQEEFVERSRGRNWPVDGALAIGPEGEVLQTARTA
jgi:UDP-N-acetylglucosamine/UDP-N-acetylgalactosamine diphosphorylase